MNGNGYLSLAELEKGIRYELKLPSHFRAKQAVFRAFQVVFIILFLLKIISLFLFYFYLKSKDF